MNANGFWEVEEQLGAETRGRQRKMGREEDESELHH